MSKTFLSELIGSTVFTDTGTCGIVGNVIFDADFSEIRSLILFDSEANEEARVVQAGEITFCPDGSLHLSGKVKPALMSKSKFKANNPIGTSIIKNGTKLGKIKDAALDGFKLKSIIAGEDTILTATEFKEYHNATPATAEKKPQKATDNDGSKNQQQTFDGKTKEATAAEPETAKPAVQKTAKPKPAAKPVAKESDTKKPETIESAKVEPLTLKPVAVETLAVEPVPVSPAEKPASIAIAAESAKPEPAKPVLAKEKPKAALGKRLPEPEKAPPKEPEKNTNQPEIVQAKSEPEPDKKAVADTTKKKPVSAHASGADTEPVSARAKSESPSNKDFFKRPVLKHEPETPVAAPRPVADKKPETLTETKTVAKAAVEKETAQKHKPDLKAGFDEALAAGANHIPARIIADFAFLLGRITTADIYDYQGSLIITSNSLILASTVAKARKAGKLLELTVKSRT